MHFYKLRGNRGSYEGGLCLPSCALARAWISLCMKWVLHPGPRAEAPVLTLRGRYRLACASAAAVQFMAHLFPVLFPVQQVIENHILKLFQSNLVPATPE